MTPRWFWFSAGTLVVAIVASVATVVSDSPAQRRTFKKKAALDKSVQMGFAQRTENLGGPLGAAEEAYALRAYPESEIPMAFTWAAKRAFTSVKNRGFGRRKRTPGEWSLVGPSVARYPALLTFSGADYVTSGRITALAIAPNCAFFYCPMWLGAAGGGVWKTHNAVLGIPYWEFVSESFASNAIGTITLDPRDPWGNTVYVGTGEPNASGDSAAGMGIYKTTNGGRTWTHLAAITTVGTYTGPAFDGRSISRILIDPTNPNVLYVGSARGVRGVSAVTGGATSNPPIAAPFGLYKSTDGGATFTFIWNGNASLRGVIDVELDPNDPSIVYASAFQQGIWRSAPSLEAGDATFKRVFQTLSTGLNTSRTMFALTEAVGRTRVYAADGAQGPLSSVPGLAEASQLWRVDDAGLPAAALLASQTVAGGWERKTSSDPANPYFATYNYCTGQCWYDNDVFTPEGHPDIVYLMGSYQYGEFGGISNSRGLLMSDNAGENFTDMSWDATTPGPQGIHPDHHEVVVHPDNPFLFFSATDGGIVRSTGRFRDISSQCLDRGLVDPALGACQRLLSRVPSRLTSLNNGLSTLQFQSVVISPTRPEQLMGGTQDNGTFDTNGSRIVWDQIIYGDGGQSGFSSTNSALRFNTFTGQAHDANFRGGDPESWVVIGGPIAASPEGALFYPPVIADPHPLRGGTIFEGSESVWRTQDWGGDQAYLEANCPEFTTFSNNAACGNFVRLGAGPDTRLTNPALGTRGGGNVAAVERTTGDTGTLWAATTTGRVFISKNADNTDQTAVVFTRIDTALSPGRFVSGIAVDPNNPNRAFIGFSGYSATVPSTPGHVFAVLFDPGTGAATWTNLDGGTGPMGDLPVTDVAYDWKSGDLYAATDFGVLQLPAGTTAWETAAEGLPVVAVTSLAIDARARKMVAATHGRSAWELRLR